MSGKYIVVFKDHVSEDKINKVVGDVTNNGGEVTHRYDSTVMKGFSAKIPNQYFTELQSLQGDEIDYIEPDTVVTTQ